MQINRKISLNLIKKSIRICDRIKAKEMHSNRKLLYDNNMIDCKVRKSILNKKILISIIKYILNLIVIAFEIVWLIII